MHTRIRVGCSNLNEDLYYRNLKETPLCDCGYEIEDAEHYFLKCKNYEAIRQHIQDATNINIFKLGVEELIFGSEDKDTKENSDQFELIQYYIALTRRFA